MLEFTIPGRGDLVYENLLLDVNGTIALDGELLEGVSEAIEDLRGHLRVVLATADTHGGAERLGERLGAEVLILEPGQEDLRKERLVAHLGAAATIAIGNGANDALMLAAAGLGIAVIGPEGSAASALAAADVVAPDIGVALGMLRSPGRLLATLRS